MWDAVGFPENGAASSTLWIGSSGAHTPCHADTYGCNVVVQVYGRSVPSFCVRTFGALVDEVFVAGSFDSSASGVVLSASTKSGSSVGEEGLQNSQILRYIRFSVSGKFSGRLVLFT